MRSRAPVAVALFGLCALPLWGAACAEQHPRERPFQSDAAEVSATDAALDAAVRDAGAVAAVREASAADSASGDGAEPDLDDFIRQHGCEAAQARLYADLRLAVAGYGDDPCETSADCRVLQGYAACLGCYVGARDRENAARASARVAAVVSACEQYAAAECPAATPVMCADRTYVPVCMGRRCVAAERSCEPGCTAQDGICRGAAGSACDGCPEVWEEAHGKPCDRPGKGCYREGDERSFGCTSGEDPSVWLIAIPL